MGVEISGTIHTCVLLDKSDNIVSLGIRNNSASMAISGQFVISIILLG
jgi:hypothetical protein